MQLTVLYFCRFHFKIVDLFTVNRKVCWFILLLSSSPVSHDNGCVKCTMDTRWSMDNIWLILIGRWPQIKFCPIKPWTGSGLQWPWLLTFFHQILIRPPWSQCENLYYIWRNVHEFNRFSWIILTVSTNFHKTRKESSWILPMGTGNRESEASQWWQCSTAEQLDFFFHTWCIQLHLLHKHT